jgi:serine/threonine protein phosphatase 1
MRALAIGDIHGCSRALDALLAALSPTSNDLVVTLGDYVDWGPDSRGILERVIDLSTSVRLVALRGNHEEMMLRARTNPNERSLWLKLGGSQTEQSYGGAGIPDRHWRFLETECLDVFQTASHVFVHAGVDPNVSIAQQTVACLRWKTFHDPKPHCSGKVVVCGHSTQRSGWPCDLGHSVCIDTGASRGGWLTCLDVSSGEFVQSNQKGELRTGRLSVLRDNSSPSERSHPCG